LRTYFITRNRLLLVQRNPYEFNKTLAYFYILGIVVMLDILKYACSVRLNHLKATFRALIDFIKL